VSIMISTYENKTEDEKIAIRDSSIYFIKNLKRSYSE
jgi:hypothetical protein